MQPPPLNMRCSGAALPLGFRQLIAISWRTWLIRLRRPFASVLEIGLPVLLFTNLAWVNSWNWVTSQGTSTFPGLPLFPITNLFSDRTIGSQAKWEVDAKGRTSAAVNSTCDYLEMSLSAVDSVVSCNLANLTESLQAVLSGQFGQWLAPLLNGGPGAVSLKATDAVQGLQNFGMGLYNIQEYQSWFSNSSWPSKLDAWAESLEQELMMVHDFARTGHVAPEAYNASLLALARDTPWDLHFLASGVMKFKDWVESKTDFRLSSLFQGAKGVFTRGFMSWTVALTRKMVVGKILKPMFTLVDMLLGLIRLLVQKVHDMDLAAVVRELDGVVWHTSHFLSKRGSAAGLLGRYTNESNHLGPVDRYLERFFSFIHEGLPSGTRRPAIHLALKTNAGQTLLRALEQLQSLSPELLEALDTARAGAKALNKQLLQRLPKYVTTQFLNALKDIDEGRTDVLVHRHLTWLERGWRERCPFRREDLSIEKLANILNRARMRCPFYRASLDTSSIEFEHFADWFHRNQDYLRNLDTGAFSAAVGMFTELLNHPRVILEASKITSGVVARAKEMLSDVPATTSVQNPARWAAPLAEGLHAEYLRLRGKNSTPQCKAEAAKPTQKAISESKINGGKVEILNRRLLVAPYNGESRQLLEFLAAEISQTATTWRSAPKALRSLMQCPLLRGAASRGAQHLLDFFIIGLPDEDALEAHFLKNSDRVLAGIVFKSANRTTGNFPDGDLRVEYSLRMHAQVLPQTSKLFRINPKSSNTCAGDYPYYKTGFAVMQDLMGRAVARLQAWRMATGSRSLGAAAAGRATAPHTDVFRNIEASERVAPAYDLDVRAEQLPLLGMEEESRDHQMLKPMLPAFVIVGLIPTVCVFAKDVVYERQERLRDVMRVMGLKTWVYWLGLPLLAALQLGVLVTLLLSLGNLGGYIHHSDFGIMFIFLWIFSLSCVTFASLVSSFFGRADVAAAVTGTLFLASFLPAQVYHTFQDSLPLHLRSALCLSSNTCMSFGLATILKWEAALEGAQWANLAQPPPTAHGIASPYEQLTLGYVLGMLLLDAMLYLVLAWYVERVRPGPSGLPQPWYFPILASFWCERRLAREAAGAGCGDAEERGQPLDCYEAPMQGQEAFVRVHNLRRAHRNGKEALRGISFDMHRNTITGLLGHNGAGKTTTMAIMSGFYPPTSGDVVLNGISIHRDAEKVRRTLGVSLQHDALYDELSPEEHLWFFARIKSATALRIDKEVDNLLQRLHLSPQRHSPSGSLSMGTRRCLSMGCAMVGGSEVLILDEPTAGIDAASRREIWHLLMHEKQHRTMLLSTHFMDEADLLCDRVAIIAEGRMVAIGSSVALKQHFMVGYSLRLKAGAGAEEPVITSAVHSALPTARYTGTSGRQLLYELPVRDRKHFSSLFALLQNQMALERLRITAFDVNAATLENVLHTSQALGPARMPKSPAALPAEGQKEETTLPSTMLGKVTEEVPLAVGPERVEKAVLPRRGQMVLLASWRLLLSQLRTLLWKRLLETWRDGRVRSAQILWPAFVVGLAVILAAVNESWLEEPALRFDAGVFGTRMTAQRTADESRGQRILCTWAPQVDPLGVQLCRTAQGVAAGGSPGGVPAHMLAARSAMGDLLRNATQLASSVSMAMSVAAVPQEVATVTLWFGGRAYHALPAVADLWNNVRLRLLGLEGAMVQSWSHPLPGTQSLLEEEMSDSSQVLMDGVVAVITALIMAFVAASIVAHLVHEKASRCKHQQLVTGVSPITYWVSNYLFDVATLLVPVLVIVFFITLCQLSVFSGDNAMAAILLMCMYAFAVVPQMHCAVQMFSISGTAYASMLCLNVSVSMISLICIIFWESQARIATTKSNAAVGEMRDDMEKVVGLLFGFLSPSYCLGKGLMSIAEHHRTNVAFIKYGACKTLSEQCYMPPLSWEVSAKYLASMIFAMPLWLVLLALQESGLLLRPLAELRDMVRASSAAKGYRPLQMHHDSKDSDTEEAEAACCKGRHPAHGSLVLDNLHKAFPGCWPGKPALHAVRGLCLTVQPGECFGLLGANGAGKTTSLRMVCGDIRPSSGDVIVGGCSIRHEREAAQGRLGFCPQTDLIPEKLTTREVLEFFARIRGLAARNRDRIIDDLMKQMLLQPYAGTLTKNLSGGNRRKLSAAVALVGQPRFVILDEPSVGIDVYARRVLWNVVAGLLHRGCTVLLATNSMDECEALCSRLAIIEHGSLCRLGTPVQLKAQEGQGYMLTVKAKADTATTELIEPLNQIQRFLASLLPGASFGNSGKEVCSWPASRQALDAQAGFVRCCFRPMEEANGMTISNVFAAMEKAFAQGGALHEVALDYVISQVSFEDTVLHLLGPPGPANLLQVNTTGSEGEAAK